MTLFCFGDSITYGNWDAEGGWVGRLRKNLDSKSLAAYTANELYSKYYTLTYNLGIPGDTSAGLLERFESEMIPRFNPDELTVIIFAIGINDTRYYQKAKQYETEPGVYEQNLWDLWEIAKKYTADVAFIGLTPVNEAFSNPVNWEPDKIYSNEVIEKYNDILRNFCKSRETPFIDLYERMRGMNLNQLLEDGIHPNSEGHKIMEEIIRKEMFEGRD